VTLPAPAELLVLLLPDGRRVPIKEGMTIGRSEQATIRLEDETVSRMHARIVGGPDGLAIEDAGSRFGVLVEPPEPEADSTAPASQPPARARPDGTFVVPVGATALGLRPPPRAPDGTMRPRLRSGWALKRLDDDPDAPRYILRDLRTGAFMRIGGADAALLELLDGQRTIPELLAAATQLHGRDGAGRLARLIADCGERGMLDGIGAAPAGEREQTRLGRILTPRELTFDRAGGFFERAYARWGRLYFTPLAVTGLIVLALVGVVTFSYLIGARYGTPLVVAHRLLLGGLVFIAGRFVLVAVHETAHGLALGHYGRRTDRAGLRLVIIFPYAFVDTSEAYFEPRAHRMVVSAAGPLSDLALGAIFSIACAAAPRGNVRDVFFQLAFAAYVGAFFNINPFLDRDGYQVLTEWLREPRLRQRARAQLTARLSGHPSEDVSARILRRYAIAGLLWSLLGAGFVIVLSLRYYDRLAALAPHGLVSAGFIVFFVGLLLPVPIALGIPLLRRARFGSAEVNRVIR
jgi:putative peptide zinc metalloprotease protein